MTINLIFVEIFEGLWRDLVNMTSVQRPMEKLKTLRLFDPKNIPTTTNVMEPTTLQFCILNEMSADLQVSISPTLYSNHDKNSYCLTELNFGLFDQIVFVQFAFQSMSQCAADHLLDMHHSQRDGADYKKAEKLQIHCKSCKYQSQIMPNAKNSTGNKANQSRRINSVILPFAPVIWKVAKTRVKVCKCDSIKLFE